MSIFSAALDVATHVAAEAAGSLPVTGAGTLAAQVKIFGFGATAIGAEANAVAHNENVGVALTALVVGIVAVGLLPEAALIGSTALIVDAALPILGASVSRAALMSIVGGVLEVGIAGLAESIIEPVLQGLLDTLGDIAQDYRWPDYHDPLTPYNPNSLLPLSMPQHLGGFLPDWLAPQAGAQGAGSVVNNLTPLVLDLDGDGVEVNNLRGFTPSNVRFDMNNNGFAERTAWVTGGDGLLAIDRNGNGVIDNQSELFGNTSTYADGFANLKSLDSNLDNKITSADAQYGALSVWVDANANGVTEAGELKTLAQRGITEIGLTVTAPAQAYNNDNRVIGVSTFVQNGVTRSLQDVSFRTDQTDTVSLDQSVTLDVRTLFLPTLKGFGTLKDLHYAMSGDTVLLELVQDFAASWTLTRFGDRTSLNNDVRAILERWAGLDTVPVDATLYGMNARQFLFVEKLLGQKPAWWNASLDPAVSAGPNSVNTTNFIYNNSFNALKAMLIFQSGAESLFDEGHYKPSLGDVEIGDLTQTGVNTIAAAADSLGVNETTFWWEFSEFFLNLKAHDEISQAETAMMHQIILPGGYGPWDQFISSWARGSYGIYIINGSDQADLLIGSQGTDILDPGAGDDIVHGGDGPDTLKTSAGNDYLYGEAGNDYLYDYEGNNVFFGGAGDDTITAAGSGNDIIEGGDGNDTMAGGGGTDTAAYVTALSAVTVNLSFTSAQNTYGAGTDTLTAFENLTGSNFNDTLTGDGNANVIEGGNGNDILNGAAGIDTASYASTTAGVTVNLANTSAQNTIGAGTDTLSNFENLMGSAFNDILTGDVGDNVIDGGAGNDTIQGGLGNDTLLGGLGLDTVSYQAATAGVTVNLTTNVAQNTLGAGMDTITGFENLIGSAFNDTLTGDANANSIEGGLGNDTLNGAAGIDTASYSSASAGVTVSLETLIAQNTVGAGIDTLSGIENVTGSAFNDTLNGDAGANILIGGAGNDTLKGRDGNDTIYGGDGNDTIEGNNGDDIIYGGLGADTIKGSSNVDTFVYLSVAEGGDTIQDFSITSGEKIDLMGIMQNIAGFQGAQAFSAGYLRVAQNGTSAEIYVDINGSAVSGGETLIATLQNVTASNLTLTSFILPTSVAGGNTAPVANNDNASTNEDTAVTIVVLANDTDANSDPLSVSILTGAAHGALLVNPNNTVTYTPNANYYGADSFTYLINDGHGGTASASVSLSVASVNDAPIAQDDVFSGTQNTNITGNLLVNNGNGADSDIDGDTLSVTAQTLSTAHGSVTIAASGAFTYTPTTGYTGADSFTYTLQDGHGGSDTGLVSLTVTPSGIMGTSGNDSITGTAGNDTIYGLAGNDTLKGSDGNDILYGGDGVDYLEGNNGDDTLYGGLGADSLKGSAGIDTFAWLSMAEAGDTIQDYNKATNEKIDISDLLIGYDPLTSLITDFVQITDNGTNSFLAVDVDGGANNFVMLATLNTVTGMTDEAAQLAAGRLIVV